MLASDPGHSFSFDNRLTEEEGDPNEKCPNCNKPLIDHRNSDLKDCAISELKRR